MPDLLTPLWRASELPPLAAADWEPLLGQARVARLGGRLAGLVEERGWRAQVPPPAWVHLHSGRLAAELLARRVRGEFDHLRRALAGLPGPVVLLKGAAYLAAGLPPGRDRLFGDVDILVPREQLRAVEMALFAAGWIPEKLDAYDERYYRSYMHELPPLMHFERGSALDVHHAITPPTSRFAVDGAVFLAHARPLPDWPGLWVLDAPDMAIHSAVHLMQDGEFGAGLRDLLDLDALLRHFGADPRFAPALLARAGELGLARPLWHALMQVERLFGASPGLDAAALDAAFGPPPAGARLMQRLLADALVPEHPSSDSRRAARARWLLYVRAHWLRMPWYMILPHLARKAGVRALARLKPEKPAQAAQA